MVVKRALTALAAILKSRAAAKRDSPAASLSGVSALNTWLKALLTKVFLSGSATFEKASARSRAPWAMLSAEPAGFTSSN